MWCSAVSFLDGRLAHSNQHTNHDIPSPHQWQGQPAMLNGTDGVKAINKPRIRSKELPGKQCGLFDILVKAVGVEWDRRNAVRARPLGVPRQLASFVLRCTETCKTGFHLNNKRFLSQVVETPAGARRSPSQIILRL